MRSPGLSLSFPFPRERPSADSFRLTIYSLILITCPSQVDAQKTDARPLAARNHRAWVRDAMFHSSSLDLEMRYRVLLARGYGNGGRFPVLYLLHGVYGEYVNWE